MMSVSKCACICLSLYLTTVQGARSFCRSCPLCQMGEMVNLGNRGTENCLTGNLSQCMQVPHRSRQRVPKANKNKNIYIIMCNHPHES